MLKSITCGFGILIILISTLAAQVRFDGPLDVQGIKGEFFSEFEIFQVDVDNDGFDDIVYGVFNRPHYNIFWQRNTGDSFSEPVALVSFGTPFYTLFDMDGDGLTDILGLDIVDDVRIVRWYKNTPDGFVLQEDVFQMNTTGEQVSRLLDFDQDGDPDIITLAESDSIPYHDIYCWYENTGNQFADRKTLGAIFIHSVIHIVDLDNDGKNEWLCFNMSDLTLDWFKIENKSLAPAQKIVSEDSVLNVHNIYVADIDNDNDEDLLFMEEVMNYFWCPNIENSYIFGPVQNITLPEGTIDFFDWDHDGDNDSIARKTFISGYDSSGFIPKPVYSTVVNYHENTGNFTYGPATQIYATQGYSIYNRTMLDLDNDSDMDLFFVAAGHDSLKVCWFRNESGPSGIGSTPGTQPAGFGLLSNYPNPFNPETHIKFDIPEADQVVIEIFDIQGRLVNTLVNGRFDAGRHSVAWKGVTAAGIQAASGMYFYRVCYRDQMLTQKMLLIR